MTIRQRKEPQPEKKNSQKLEKKEKTFHLQRRTLEQEEGEPFQWQVGTLKKHTVDFRSLQSARTDERSFGGRSGMLLIFFFQATQRCATKKLGVLKAEIPRVTQICKIIEGKRLPATCSPCIQPEGLP
jgi:hypothetical protein